MIWFGSIRVQYYLVWFNQSAILFGLVQSECNIIWFGSIRVQYDLVWFNQSAILFGLVQSECNMIWFGSGNLGNLNPDCVNL